MDIKNRRIEILINPLIDFVSGNNTFLDIGQIKELNASSIKNKSKWKAKDLNNEKVDLITTELYYRRFSKAQRIQFFFKCEYIYTANLIDKNEVNEIIKFNFIRYGFMPFEITNESKLYPLPYESENPIRKDQYRCPSGLNNFKKVKIRKRKLVCHYTKRQTTVEKILPLKSIRFNELSYTNDPWEYKKNIKISSEKIEKFFEALHKQFIVERLINKVKSISFTRDSIKSRCFENILMWAHYADNHKGICLVFDENKLKKLYENQFIRHDRFNPKNVQYIKISKNISVDDNDEPTEILNKYAKSLFYTKNKAWKYESEYRLMLKPDNKKDTFLKEIDQALVAVVLGLEFPEVYKCVLQELTRNHHNVMLYKMKWNPNGHFEATDLRGTDSSLKSSEILNDYIAEI